MSTASVLALWFSKDRAFQLQQALRTFDRFADSGVAAVSHAVLYRSSSPQHQRAYEQLAQRHPRVTFVDETSSAAISAAAAEVPGLSHFPLHLRAILSAHPQCGHVLLAVDDLFFFAPFSLSAALQLMTATPTLLTVHLALHPLLTFHQPSASPITPPAFLPPGQLSVTADVEPGPPSPYLLFEHSGVGSHDFRYPFSLTASLYRRQDVQSIVDALTAERSPWHHPNLLEAAGNALISTMASVPAPIRAFLPPHADSASALTLTRQLAACPATAMCAVLTVNRVQEVFKNPVCEAAGQDVEELRALWEEGQVELDEDRYAAWARAGQLRSVHVGEWWLRPVRGG